MSNNISLCHARYSRDINVEVWDKCVSSTKLKIYIRFPMGKKEEKVQLEGKKLLQKILYNIANHPHIDKIHRSAYQATIKKDKCLNSYYLAADIINIVLKESSENPN